MPSSEKRVLVTGATGLIGKELVVPLHEAGFEVHALTIDETNPPNGIHWIKADLFDEAAVREAMEAVRPTHLLNMAWATTGDYLVSPVNYRFLQAGISLSRAFAENGGKRAVFAGTCFEYKFKDSPLSEDGELEPGKYAYTFCKDLLRRFCERYFAERGVSFGYGRVFYVFGRNEHPSRLAGMLVDRLERGLPVEIRTGSLSKDYVYAKDVAAAFAAILDSSVEGCVNVCSGQATTIRDFALELARNLNAERLVEFHDLSTDQPPIIVGNPGRLFDEVGFRPRWTVKNAIADLLRQMPEKNSQLNKEG